MKKSLIAMAALGILSGSAFAATTDTAEVEIVVAVEPSCVFNDTDKVFNTNISGVAGEVAFGNVTMSTICSASAPAATIKPRNELARTFGDVEAGAVDQTVGTMSLEDTTTGNGEVLTLRPYTDASLTQPFTSVNSIATVQNGVAQMHDLHFKLTGQGADLQGEGNVIINAISGTVQYPIELSY